MVVLLAQPEKRYNTIPSPSSVWHAGNKCYILVNSKLGYRMHSLPMLLGLIVQILC